MSKTNKTAVADRGEKKTLIIKHESMVVLIIGFIVLVPLQRKIFEISFPGIAYQFVEAPYSFSLIKRCDRG